MMDHSKRARYLLVGNSAATAMGRISETGRDNRQAMTSGFLAAEAIAADTVQHPA